MPERAPTTDTWALVAPYYDLFLPPASAAPVLDLLGPRLGDVRHGVLEVGAGTGRIGLAVATALPGVPVVLSEPSSAMRAVLAGKVAARGDLRGRVTVRAGGVTDVDPGRPVDLVLCVGVVWALPPESRPAAWRRLAGLLVPGGLLVLDTAPPDRGTSGSPSPSRVRSRVRRGDEVVVRTVWSRPGDGGRHESVFEIRVERSGAVVRVGRSRAVVWTPAASTVLAELAAAGFRHVADRPDPDGDRLTLVARSAEHHRACGTIDGPRADRRGFGL